MNFLQRAWRAIGRLGRDWNIPKWFLVLLAVLAALNLVVEVMDLAARPMFIFEEALQTGMQFAGWGASDAAEIDPAAWTYYARAYWFGLETVRGAEGYTDAVGWINFLAAPSYRAYWKGSRQFLNAMRANLCVKEPSLCPPIPDEQR